MASEGAISAAHVADLERRLAEAEAARTLAETLLARAEEARARLERMIAQARRDKFGAKSEKLDPDQQNLPFEDLEVAEGMLAAATEAAEKSLGKRRKPTKGKARKLPAAAPPVRAPLATATCRNTSSGSSRSSSPTASCAPAAAARWWRS